MASSLARLVPMWPKVCLNPGSFQCLRLEHHIPGTTPSHVTSKAAHTIKAYKFRGVLINPLHTKYVCMGVVKTRKHSIGIPVKFIHK